MTVTCCSRPPPTYEKKGQPAATGDYESLTAVGVECHPLKLRRASMLEGLAEGPDGDGRAGAAPPSFDAGDVSRALMNRTVLPGSVLTVNESVVVTMADGTELVCRVDAVQVDVISEEPVEMAKAAALSSSSVRDVTMDEPYRGRVGLNTEFYVRSTDLSTLSIRRARSLPLRLFPDDVVHVTTGDDMEWFPVRRVLLAPCIKLTRYVQAGRGKCKDVPTLPAEERSEDAPVNDGCPHCQIPMDCCTFDRVLVFITSLLFPGESTFTLDPAEVNTLADAADWLGLQPLSDLCASQTSSFESRVRRDSHIRLAEVMNRNNNHGELLIVLDGMVLDITRWLEEHPGGPSIIPAQALNMDCTVFFEMYHVSRQAFLYLKSFYIGELSLEDLASLRSSADGVKPSEAFLFSLRSYTDEWRVKITHGPDKKAHKSL